MKTDILTVIWRFLRLLCWLFTTAYRLHRLNNATLTQRQEELLQISTSCLYILNVNIQTSNKPTINLSNTGVLIVANHVSWLDIFVISSLYPSSFIAMQELATWPMIGKMARNAGTVFINRSNRKEINLINAAIAERLQQNMNVCFFPEAKTSSGNDVLPLKAALFQSAIDTNSLIQIMALRYYDARNKRSTLVSFANVSLLPSLWRILRMPKITVHVDFEAPMNVENYDRFQLKDKAEIFLKSKIRSDSPDFDHITS